MSERHPTSTINKEMPDISGHDWPLRSGLPLGPIPTAASCARAHTTQVLWEWGMAQMSDTAQLIVSELVSNAVTASLALDDGPFPVRFWLLSDRKQVLVLVWDASPDPPIRMQPSADVEGGRGLMLVDAMSTQWNWYSAADNVEGKVVWALISK
jgi:anti-sigma regulatory factor (Ser/Thr protein kinase)